jgi:hypothetical protein
VKNVLSYVLFLVGCPNILNRSSWHARPDLRHDNLTLPLTHIVIRQLLNTTTIMNQQDCINEVKNLQDFQMDIKGWDDINYNFLICTDNDDQQEIYKGRGWTYRGAHCIGYNPRSLGKNQFHLLFSRITHDRLWRMIEKIETKTALCHLKLCYSQCTLRHFMTEWDRIQNNLSLHLTFSKMVRPSKSY